MTASSPAQRYAMMAAAEAEWQANARDEWGKIDFWHWPRSYDAAFIVSLFVR